ncbi:hypothetical protein ACEWY4_006017 [Coilia grayii]|uniref:Myb/SANT-like DNA-binding domain-containing protein n=1 Tax=Coilia grayii TaxID=363190 RepID=A0ABD1KCB3_9TELE
METGCPSPALDLCLGFLDCPLLPFPHLGSSNRTPEETRRLIRFRAENEQRFMKSKAAAKQLWETLVKDLGLQGTITSQQASTKWENLKKKYKELKTPKTGSGTDAGETTASTWQFFEEMHEVLGSRPSIDPPVVVASFAPDADPDPIPLVMVKTHPSHGLFT